MANRSEFEIDVPGVSPHTKLSDLTVKQFVQLLIQTSNQLRAARSTPEPETLKKIFQTIRKFNSEMTQGTEEQIFEQLPELMRRLSKDVGAQL
jgi:hypothetical protein